MDTKMMSDMPLPMPRCVMSSPIHMMNAVPATSVKTTMMSVRISGTSLVNTTPYGGALEQEEVADSVNQAKAQRQKTRDLGDLAATGFSLFRPATHSRE